MAHDCEVDRRRVFPLAGMLIDSMPLPTPPDAPRRAAASALQAGQLKIGT